MASHGIKDRVAIVGMGCTKFAEHWDKSSDDLVIDSTNEAFASAGVGKQDIDAYWLGTAQTGMAGITLSIPLKLEGKPVTRVGTSSPPAARPSPGRLRRASGAYYLVAAFGVEKVKDGGYQGLNSFPHPHRRHQPHAHRRRDVLVAAAGVLQEVRRRRGRDPQVIARIGFEEPLQRAPQRAAPSTAARCRPSRSAASRSAGRLAVMDAAGVAEGRPR